MKMEQHTTTTASSRPQATPRARPLGGRKFTDRHATADWCARRFKPKPDFDRLEAVQILEEIGTHLPQDRRMTPQLRRIQRQTAEDPDTWPTSPDARVIRRGRPAGARKAHVSVRLDLDVLAALKTPQEKGWQTRLNRMLRDGLELDAE